MYCIVSYCNFILVKTPPNFCRDFICCLWLYNKITYSARLLLPHTRSTSGSTITLSNHHGFKTTLPNTWILEPLCNILKIILSNTGFLLSVVAPVPARQTLVKKFTVKMRRIWKNGHYIYTTSSTTLIRKVLENEKMIIYTMYLCFYVT